MSTGGYASIAIPVTVQQSVGTLQADAHGNMVPVYEITLAATIKAPGVLGVQTPSTGTVQCVISGFSSFNLVPGSVLTLSIS